MIGKMKCLTVVASALLLVPFATSADETAATVHPEERVPMTEVKVHLRGYVFGFRMIKTDFTSAYTDKEYYAFASLQTSGLGALLKKFKIWSLTTGRFTSQNLKPVSHLQQNLNKKKRRVEMKYGADKVDVNIVPRLGSQGKPPASEEQRFHSSDTLSALLNMTMRGSKIPGKPCEGSVPVFDSKQHYELRLKHAGEEYIKQRGFKGNTIRCHVYYVPVSGFDPEDLPNKEEVSTPVKINIAHFPQHDLYIPVKMKYEISGFTAMIKTRDIQIRTKYVDRFPYIGQDFDAQESALHTTGLLGDD